MRSLTVLAAVVTLANSPGLVAAQDVSAQGNEPFWRVDVALNSFTLTRPDFDPVILTVTDRTPADGGGAMITAMTSSPALRAVLALSPGPCRDTMADQTYPFDATVEMGEMTLIGCGGDPADLLTAANPWTVTFLGGSAVLPETEVTLIFDTEGGLSGNGGCNQFAGGYEITGEGVSIGPVAATRIACADAIMGQEQLFFAALEVASAFDIGDSGALRLIGPDGAIIVASPP